MMRTPVIIGNWKMNLTNSHARELVQAIHYSLRHPGEVDVAVVPTFLSISDVVQTTKKSYIGVGAQNVHYKESGAFTGEISAEFLKDAGVDYILIGHSERRQYFGEDEELLNKKLAAVNRVGLTPVLCLGETLDERERGDEFDVIGRQLIGALKGIDPSKLIVAYEPVWAIGTGKVATSEQVESIHLFIRKMLAKIFDENISSKIRIQYGGSVKPGNCKELLALPNVDGALVGGAALNAGDFVAIVNGAFGG